MSNPVVVIGAAWLLVIGYALVFVGWQNLSGSPVSFAKAFFGKG